jgi:hypothetical protein
MMKRSDFTKALMTLCECQDSAVSDPVKEGGKFAYMVEYLS